MERKDFLRQGGPCFYFDTELFAPTTDSFALGWFAAPKRGERVCCREDRRWELWHLY